jgi:phosphoesterase RecJ-like protein
MNQEATKNAEFTYASSATVEEIAARIRSAKHVMLTTHARPDGDAVGSVYALARGIKAQGGTPEIALMGPIEPPLKGLMTDISYKLVENAPPTSEPDLIVITDTGSWAQVRSIADYLRPRREKIVGIDHHVAGDDVASMRWVEPKSASTTEMVATLFDALGWQITGGRRSVAEALFVGMATDTGWFRYGNATAHTFRVAARLIEAGVDRMALYSQIEQTYRPQRLQLEARALASLQFLANSAVAIQTLRTKDFAETGAKTEDMTGLVNSPLVVSSVIVSILIAQYERSRTKISFRSKVPPFGRVPTHLENVNKLAQRFGGGGHTHAAGATVEMDTDRAFEEVVKAVNDLARVS